jgi:predicted metal-dependent hydrolase
MTLRQRFLDIKHLFFPRWDRQNRWQISTKSRRNVHGHCDRDRRVIAIVIQHTDPDERDKLLIHEICHAVANGSHGKVWQRRMEEAARRADELGRDVLAKILRQEIVNYQEFAEGREQAYQTVQDWLNAEPDLTLAQVKRSLADLTGLLVSEVSTKLRRFEKVYRAAKREALEARAMKAMWVKEIQG